MSEFRFAVDVLPRPGILDPQGRAVEQALPHLGIASIGAVRVGRHVELTAVAGSEAEARAVVERLAQELLSNPLIETFSLQILGATSSTTSEAATPAVETMPVAPTAGSAVAGSTTLDGPAAGSR